MDELSDLETAKQVAELLQRENDRLHKRLVELTQENASLRGKKEGEQLELELLRLQEQMAGLQAKVFGASSERRAGGTRTSTREPRERARGTQQRELPIDTEDHSLADDDRDCHSCGGTLEEWTGQFEEFEEVDIVERQFRVKHHRRKKYRCRCGSAPVTAPGPVRIPGSEYSLDFAIAVAVDKYSWHGPLERQAARMAMENLPIGSGTLWRQIDLLAGVLSDTYDALGDHVIKAEVLHADETPWWLLKKGRQKWWAWTFSRHDAVIIRIDKSRGHQVPKTFLEGFEGVLAVDGYGAYKTLRGAFAGKLELALCWSHARRKFIEAEDAYPQVQQALELIRDLFLIERELPDFRSLAGDAREAALAEIASVRTERSAPLIEKLQQWRQEQRALPQSKLGTAVSFLTNHWNDLTRFLRDPRAPLSNNQAERSLRPAVVGRKNHYGSKSKRGIEVAELFYSLCGTCRALGINASHYLRAAAERALTEPGAVLLPHEFAAATAATQDDRSA